MDHAIMDLKNRLQGAIEMYMGRLSRAEVEPEVKAYVKAINALEKYLYGEERTNEEIILALLERGEKMAKIAQEYCRNCNLETWHEYQSHNSIRLVAKCGLCDTVFVLVPNGQVFRDEVTQELLKMPYTQ